MVADLKLHGLGVGIRSENRDLVGFALISRDDAATALTWPPTPTGNQQFIEHLVAEILEIPPNVDRRLRRNAISHTAILMQSNGPRRGL
jgi:hypothetical protein